ncbi:hypothetical protein Pcinc_003821 [Petrolisthes cinctipes]|uniref:[histone H3]-trimethyl-L-lysine(4) demethylase n=1 Tax=Petrolisthes cinctipes TaxID=88211 RepID=A0AAE1BY27_PETCI|nr:hypothetical protein Pcinc_036307 [Petrolisthes cinctipes]KAK3892322.1 hypothetical protein Pcinc_003821 [Petrolisthes cinctipes]
MASPEFQFIPPPEAPVFKPTWEEFQDALGYINKIRPIAEQSGICKIIPPPDWQPPFAVDVDNFKFTPRIQRLNELEAHTRIKLNFLDQIAKFWELQGSSLKIPVVERKALDLYSLHRNVWSEGGNDQVTKERKWNKIASRMGFPCNKNLGTLLKAHYERILQPFDIFNKGKLLPQVKTEVKEEEAEALDKDYKPHKIPSRMAGKIPDSEKNGRRSRRHPDAGDAKVDTQVGFGSEDEEDGKGSKELKRLQFYGAGPKMAGFDKASPEDSGKTRGKKVDYSDQDPLAKYICLNCGRGDDEDQMLLCDGCDDSYHIFCLVPPLLDIPKGDWRCPKCVAVEVSKPVEAFGFEQAQKEYTLQSFGEMADKFKQDYFNMPVHLIPTEMAEREFWRIVSSIDEDVTVEYGADLHTMDHGSGFPTKSSKNLLPADQEYAVSSWNLNNLPVLEGSVLGHINCDISGMKVPWMYVGMCFSTFCWHNEDHWSYSINYLHWGEPKTWYGVPGGKAESFEDSMKNAAPELFQAQPDLLHQLVTIMNPNILMKAGVPIVRTDQHAGEFVITFPRSYHAGFNQGYNFAEAVNFAPPDWLAIGRECVLHYSNLKRYCVFSHNELVCKMASTPDELDLTVAAATYQDMLRMVDLEKKLRRSLLHWGVTNAEREAFELLPDDERQCDFCKTTCFLSAVTCSCTRDRLVCLRHYKMLCECSPENHTLRYRYTLDELPPLLQSLKVRAESFDHWAVKVKEALEAKPDDKLELSELRELVEEAEAQRFPESELLQTLIQAVTEAEKCATVAAHLATKKVRTRTRGSGEAKSRLTLEELKLFYEQIESLACVVREGDAVKELLTRVTTFQQEAIELLSQEAPDSDVIAKMVDTGCSLDIDLPELPRLKHKLQQVEWLEEVEETLEGSVTVDCVRKLLDSGISLPPHPKIEKAMAQLQQLLTNMETWEEKASQALNAKPGISVSEGEELLKQAEEVPAHLPSVVALKDAVKRAREWTNKVTALQKGETPPLLETVEGLVARGRPISLHLEPLAELEENVAAAHAWLEKTARTFLKKNSHLTLLEVLVPRTDIGVVSGKRKRVKREEMSAQQQQVQLLDMSIEDAAISSSVVKAFKDCEERELGAMRALRAHNRSKCDGDTPQEGATFCLCHKPPQATMLTCSLCLDLFHSGCVPSSHRSKVKLSNEGRFLCPSCERSRRPRLETILALLVALQKLPLRLPEAEALQCLTERAMSWQDRARQLMKTEELTAALGKLSVFLQKISEAQAKQHHKAVPPQVHDDKTEHDESTNDDSLSEDNELKMDLDRDAGKKLDEGSWEHAYSSNKQLKDKKSEVDKARWSHLVATLMDNQDSPLISLSPRTRSQVQDLLVEGELLEVSLDETTHMWRILQAANHPPAMLEDTLLSFNSSNSNSDEHKIKKTGPKKRKSQGEGPDDQPRSPQKSPIKKTKLSKLTPNTIEGKTPKAGMVKKKTMLNKMIEKKKKDFAVNNKEGPKKKGIGLGRKKKNFPPSNNGMHSDEDDEDIDEACAASKCQHPSGQNVDWVQCDGCEGWFHYVCVGLKAGDIHEDEEYKCSRCTGRQPAPKPGELTEEESVDILLSLATSLPPKDSQAQK